MLIRRRWETSTTQSNRNKLVGRGELIFLLPLLLLVQFTYIQVALTTCFTSLGDAGVHVNGVGIPGQGGRNLSAITLDKNVDAFYDEPLHLSRIKQHVQCENLYGPHLILHWRKNSEEICEAQDGITAAGFGSDHSSPSIQCHTASHVTPYSKYTPTTCRFDNTLIKLRSNSWTTTCKFDLNRHRDKFTKRWYGSGAGYIIDKMNLEVNVDKYQSNQRTPQCSHLETRPTLMLMREQGPASNMFHELAQIMALYIVKHIHNIGDDVDPSQLLLIAFDRHQRSSHDDFVGLCDELLSAFSNQTVLYEEDIPSGACFTNAIFAVAGEESPLAFWHRFAEEEDAFWHSRLQDEDDDGEGFLPCHNSILLRSFVSFVLRAIGIEPALSSPRTSSVAVCWIKRRSFDSRGVGGEDEYISRLQNETSEATIDLHVAEYGSNNLKTLRSQILFTQNCNIMIGLHGAGLTHSLWMPTESIVIEILPRGFGSYRTLARAAGHQYLYVPASRGAVNWDMVTDVLDAALHLVANMGHRRGFGGL